MGLASARIGLFAIELQEVFIVGLHSEIVVDGLCLPTIVEQQSFAIMLRLTVEEIGVGGSRVAHELVNKGIEIAIEQMSAQTKIA